MVKHEKPRHSNDDKKKTVVNLGKVGGIGGVVFLGGVLATGIVTSFLAVRRRRNQNNNPRTSGSLQSFDSEEESKGLQLIVSNCCPKENHPLSNRKTVAELSNSSSVTRLTSSENLCKDNHKEGNHEGSVKNDDGNSGDLEDKKVQMDEGEQPSSSFAQEDNYGVSIVQSSTLDRNQHHDDGDTSTRFEIDEIFDSSSTEAYIVADDMIEKRSEGNNTCEDDEIHEISEEVEDNSEATLESSASKAIWPTETIQEISMAHKVEPEKDIIENTNVEVPIKQMNHSEEDMLKLILGSGMRFVDRSSLHLNSTKWGILLGTLLALLLHLCFRCNVLAF